MPEHERAAREALNEGLVMCAWSGSAVLALGSFAYAVFLQEFVTAGLLFVLAFLCFVFAIVFADSHVGRHENVIPPEKDESQREEEGQA